MSVGDIIERARKAVQSLRLDEVRDAGLLVDSEFYFPVVTYPPMSCLSSMEDDALPRGGDGSPLAAYVHIPFCRSRCSFCHWVVTTGSNEEEVNHYLDVLEAEIIIHKRRRGVERLPVSSLLIGGGTPTCLEPGHLDRLLRIIERHYDLSVCHQYSVEPEPTTLLGKAGDERLRILRAHGVDRLSMGVQSFDDGLLSAMGRVHSSSDTLRAIERIRAAGIGSISIDLIYGLPMQTVESWANTVQQAVDSGADAWQSYRLRILPHGDRPGRISGEYCRAPDRFPSTEQVRLMKMVGVLAAEENGFDEHYTRIFARNPGHISRYLYDVNVGLLDVAGVGISAWSNFASTFALSVGRGLPQYYERVRAGRLPVDRGLVRTADDESRRSLILPLKNGHVDLADFERRTGATVACRFGDAVQRLEALGLVVMDGAALRLTRRGRFCADEVALSLYASRHLPDRDLTEGSVQAAS